MFRAVSIIFMGCLLSSAANAQQRPSIAWEPFSFQAPVVGQTNAERGWFEVPIRHGRQGTGRLRLRIVRLRSTNPRPGPPIIFLAGGPGNAGTRILTSALAPHAARIRMFADVISFDQRGTGESEPSLAVPGRFDLPSAVSIASLEARQRIATLGGIIRTTMASRGVDLAAFNTIESADDVEVLRRTLGVDKVILWGHSYGTHLALAVVKRHGDHVARALLGGINGLDDRWRDPAESDAWLERVGAAMEAAASESARVGFVEQVKRVFAQLDERPIRTTTPEGDVLIGKTEIQVLVTIRSGDLASVQNLGVLFDSLERRTRLEPIAAAVQQTIRQRSIGTAMTYSMHVASGVSAERLVRIRAQAATATLGNAINWGIGDADFVNALGIPDLGDAFRAHFRSRVPVLLMSGTLDGRAAENDATRAGAQFERANYVVLDGASHDFWFLPSPSRVSEITDAFLRGDPVRDEHIRWPVSFARLD